MFDKSKLAYSSTIHFFRCQTIEDFYVGSVKSSLDVFLCGYLVPESCNLKDDSSVEVVATLNGSVEMVASA